MSRFLSFAWAAAARRSLLLSVSLCLGFSYPLLAAERKAKARRLSGGNRQQARLGAGWPGGVAGRADAVAERQDGCRNRRLGRP